MPLYAIDPADRARYPKTLALMMNGPREAGVAGVIDRLKPESIEGLAEECHVHLEQLSRENYSWRYIDEQLLYWFHMIGRKLLESSEMGNARATAMLNHYTRCIGTPANLELLVGLILVRTGETLCIAVNLLIALSHYVFGHSSMDRPLSDGGVFSSHVIRTGSQFLQRSENRHHDCQCTENVCMVLKDALEFSKERPGQLIDRLYFIAWNDILDFNYDKCDCCETPGGMKLYLQLVQIPGQLMLLGDTAETEKAKAKAMLLCLGSAQGLFRSCLELIATKKFSWLQDASSIPPERKSIETANVARASDFLFSFAAIAPALPSDRPTSKLVQRASETLAKRRPQVSLWASESILQLYDAMTKSPFFTSWSRVRNESQETRWGLFHPAIQSIIHKCNTKKQRKSVKVDYRGRIGPEECCASCFRMERDLNDQGRSLSRCARCGLVWYCSKECQASHWKEKHKANCRPKAKI